MVYYSFWPSSTERKTVPFTVRPIFSKGCFAKGQNMTGIKLCECGCGLPTSIAIRTRSKRGQKKGEPLRFINGHNTRLLGSKEQSRRVAFRNYDLVRFTGKRDNYVKLNQRHMHRVVMEKALGRKLDYSEVVHHIDGDKWNNDISNLQVLSRSEHIRIHLHAEKE